MNKKRLKEVFIIILVTFFEWHQLDISCNLEKGMHTIELQAIILNICILLIFNFIVYILINRLWLTMIVSGLLWTIIGVTNYYVIQYHGMPFTITELKNFKTAINVLGSYNLDIGSIPIIILIIGTLIVLFSVFERKYEISKKRSLKAVMLPCFAIVVCAVYIFAAGYGDTPIKPKKTIGWSWKEAYGKYGYVACVVEDLYSKSNIINKPENYNYEEVKEIYDKYANEGNAQVQETYPDIIFIVNESFYDLKRLTDFETDVDYLKNIRNMDNLLKGYAVSPTPYGGTNSSEYELITSNSLYLMKSGVTPFNVINLKGANSIVSHLKSLGYNTLGTHTESGINYNRISGYNDLGFDSVKFEEEYEDLEYYYGRWYETDASVYRNMIKWYEEMGDEPRFLYMLTIQNHGKWDLNDSEYDKIHITEGEFEITDTINEYLTSISLSDEAFFELTEYFKNVDRPVVLCMVGDHCPSFAGEIADADLSADEKALKLRETPLYIWANFELDESELGSIGMPFVVPTLLKVAGVPLSGYYEYILEISKNVPIITSYGKYFDKNYNCFSVGEEPHCDLVDQYFQVEYSNLEDRDHGNGDFFK